MNFSTAFLLLFIASLGVSRGHAKTFDIMDYGAAGDGSKDDTDSFKRAWTDLCEDTSYDPTLNIPTGKTFLVKPIIFEGPCKSASVQILVQGKIIAPTLSEWDGSDEAWILFSDVHGLKFIGHGGQIDGQGSPWWDACRKKAVEQNYGKSGCDGPTALRFQSCANLQLRGIKHINSQRNHISISKCDGAVISDLQIIAPEDSENTDGIDISHSSNVQILNSIIGTGDDCIAVNGGVSFLNINRIICGPGHGISIGSLGRDGTVDTVEEVHVKNCIFKGTQNGARIKTWQGGSGSAKKISYKNIRLISAGNPIFIDQYYCPRSQCSNQTSAVEISDVTFSGIRGTTPTLNAISLNCSQTVGCSNIVLENIELTPADTDQPVQTVCTNAHGTGSNCSPKVDCLSH